MESEVHRQHTPKKDCHKLSTGKHLVSITKSKKLKSKNVILTSESSSDEEDLPPLRVLRTSCEVQSQVDARLREIESQSKVEGTGNVSKIKSKRGVEVLVAKK